MSALPPTNFRATKLSKMEFNELYKGTELYKKFSVLFEETEATVDLDYFINIVNELADLFDTDIFEKPSVVNIRKYITDNELFNEDNVFTDIKEDSENLKPIVDEMINRSERLYRESKILKQEEIDILKRMLQEEEEQEILRKERQEKMKSERELLKQLEEEKEQKRKEKEEAKELKEQQKKNAKDLIKCPCGQTYQRGNKSHHYGTKRHLELMILLEHVVKEEETV